MEFIIASAGMVLFLAVMGFWSLRSEKKEKERARHQAEH